MYANLFVCVFQDFDLQDSYFQSDYFKGIIMLHCIVHTTKTDIDSSTLSTGFHVSVSLCLVEQICALC